MGGPRIVPVQHAIRLYETYADWSWVTKKLNEIYDRNWQRN